MTTKELARNLVKAQYKDLPEGVVKATKRSILDTLGVMLPPTTLEESCIAIYELAKEEGGTEESTLVGFGGKTSCVMAAFVNGSLIHPMDYDDSTDIPPHHPSAATIPAALAIAEKIGGVNGKDLITAIALGNDLGIRLAACPKGNIMDFPFFPITTIGPLASAAAAGKILGLSEIEMQNALGLALHRVAGTTEATAAPDSDVRAIRDAYTNSDGVMAALMASKGISAYKEAIQMLFKVYYSGEYDLKPLNEDLGKRFRGGEAGLKPWPACRGTHGCIQAILQIMKDNNIKPDDIAEVILTTGKFGEVHLCQPLEAKRNPTLSIGAKFSLPFVAAIALTKGTVQIAHFLPQNLKDPKVLKMANLINFRVNPTFGTTTPTETEIKTKDGKSYSLRVDMPRGHHQNPLSLEEIIAKFKDCATYSKKQFTNAEVEQLINYFLNLERVKDIREITSILV